MNMDKVSLPRVGDKYRTTRSCGLINENELVTITKIDNDVWIWAQGDKYRMPFFIKRNGEIDGLTPAK